MLKNRRKFSQCPNCEHIFEEVNNYCPNCGQENHDLNVPLKHLVWEFFEGTMHFDTKVWRTLKYLAFKPGLLTEKFSLGQRASYVPPFRLYVFISLIFFTALAFRSEKSIEIVSDKDLIKAQQELAPQYQAADTLTLPVQEESNETWSEFSSKIQKFASGEQSKQKLLKNVSFMMFLLMPFFGFILYLFYYKQRRNYVEHLMFSIHIHTFYFVAVIAGLIVEYFFKSFDVDTWAFWLIAIYLFFALHRVYKQSYFRTFIKMIPITMFYILLLGVLFVSTVAISVMMS